MEKNVQSKWISGGKLIGISAIVLFGISMVIIYFEAHETTNGFSIFIILFSFFLYLLYSSLITWNSINKTINSSDINQDKLSRISELYKRYEEDRSKIADFLRRRIVNFSENTQKRFGFTFTRFEIPQGKVLVIIKYPTGSDWRSNSIEIRGGLHSDLELIRDLKQFIDTNIE